MSKKKHRDPMKKLVAWTVVMGLLTAGSIYGIRYINDYRDDALQQKKDEVAAYNAQVKQEYDLAVAELEQKTQTGANLAWPAQKTEGWDVVDLTNYGLESPATVVVAREEVMNNGMLLVNQWHSRPEDFSEAGLVAVGNYAKANKTSLADHVADYKKQLFPVAVDALQAALDDAATLGYTTYMLDGGYRTYAEQEAMFNEAMDKHKSKYSGEELIRRTIKDVNYPGTSEFNSGLSFTLKLYEPGNSTINSTAYYIPSNEGIWMNENCWRYGIIFRFPKADYPTKGTLDKSYKTGVSVSLRCYRYVGKAHAAVMHHLDLCLEEYIEYLMEHPHIAVFEDGILKYEINRQLIDETAASFPVNITNKAASYSISMDNMGAVITAFEY